MIKQPILSFESVTKECSRVFYILIYENLKLSII
jgi:hypothetical protein